MCRTTIQVKKKYNAAVEKLERQLLRQPNRLEIAVEMDMSEVQLTEWEAAFQANTPQSIDSVYDQFFDLVYLVG